MMNTIHPFYLRWIIHENQVEIPICLISFYKFNWWPYLFVFILIYLVDKLIEATRWFKLMAGFIEITETLVPVPTNDVNCW